MVKPKLLDLFCCAGGAAKGYQRAGFYVVGVDIKPQPHYCGDEFIQADAMKFDLSGYECYHASPPCQHYSMMQNIVKTKSEWPDLISPTRDRLTSTGKSYVIENVYKAPLKGHLMLCGTMFNLPIIRHRYFECDWMDLYLFPPCDHRNVYDPWHKDGVGQREKLSAAMDIDWFMNRQEVREAIPPAYTEFIGKELIKII
jgi:hypothetical protein